MDFMGCHLRQRLQEKRRLQEEQDKARREKEDERLRQQQLKRKSLRDQWLMEGSPLSPLSPNSQNTFSSLWGTHDQDMEEQNDKYCVSIEINATSFTVKIFSTPHIFLHNHLCCSVKNNSITVFTRTYTVVCPGEESNDHSSSGQNEDITAPFGVTEDPNNIRVEPEISVTVPACTQDPHANKNEEEKGEDEDGTVVIRAEPVYITEDGSGDLSSLKNQQESALNPEGVQEILHAMEEVSETEGAPETSPELETVEAAELTSAAETKHQAPAPPQEAEEAVNVEEPESKLSQFQEVQLTDPEPGEQEALLQKHQAPNLSSESAGSNSPVSSETQSPNKAIQGEKSPKQKTCQCCSLM
uniref:Paralemmin 3 n=1 Tax=Cyprinodon variegatus TaxID=28743 RepID=A0A3Q2DDH4_CYPVA